MDPHFTPAQRAYLEDRILNPLAVISAMLQKWTQTGAQIGTLNPDVHRAMAAVDEITDRIRALDKRREENGLGASQD